MGFKQIRYTTDFKTKDLAKDAMKKAKAYNAPGIGKWDITINDEGRVCYIFTPGRVLVPMLNKTNMWLKVAMDTTKEFKKALPDNNFAFNLE